MFTFLLHPKPKDKHCLKWLWPWKIQRYYKLCSQSFRLKVLLIQNLVPIIGMFQKFIHCENMTLEIIWTQCWIVSNGLVCSREKRRWWHDMETFAVFKRLFLSKRELLRSKNEWKWHCVFTFCIENIARDLVGFFLFIIAFAFTISPNYLNF